MWGVVYSPHEEAAWPPASPPVRDAWYRDGRSRVGENTTATSAPALAVKRAAPEVKDEGAGGVSEPLRGARKRLAALRARCGSPQPNDAFAQHVAELRAVLLSETPLVSEEAAEEASAVNEELAYLRRKATTAELGDA
jgi:hypothetical protein